MNIIIGSYNQRLANRFSRKVRITFEDALAASAGPPAASRPQCDSHAIGVGSPHVSKGSTSNDSPFGTKDRAANSQFSTLNSQLPRPSRGRLNTVAEWETGLGGVLRAVGVGGGITGFGADLVIIDDPIKSRSEAESKTYRDRTYEWFNDDLYTRLEPDARIILIQTRWHEDDLAGRLLKEMSDGGENWEVISLPALAERNADAPVRMSAKHEKTPPTANCQPPTEITPRSPDPLGRAPGEPLCPDRFSKDDLLRIKKRLGSYSFSALYQQRPTPPEGGLFKRQWFSRIVDRAPEGLWWCRGYDLAVSTKDNADYTASFRCALDKQTGDLYIADGFRGRLEFPEQRRLIVQKIKDEPNTEHGIEQALHGQAFVQDLRREHRLFGRAFRGIKVSTDKFTRALSWANLAEDGKVVLVRGLWIDAFLDEVCSFPNSQYDDQLDAVSLAVEMLSRQTNRAHGF